MKLLLATALLAMTTYALDESESFEIFPVLIQEMERSKAQLRFEDYPQPYLISLRATKNQSWQKGWRDGVSVFSKNDKSWHLAPEVRVGDYQLDQSPDNWAAQNLNETIAFSSNPLVARHHLRNAIDEAYKNACSLYLQKKAKRAAEGIPEYATDDYSYLQDKPVYEVNGSTQIVDLEAIGTSHDPLMSQLSLTLSGDPLILRSLVRIEAGLSETWLVTTEGSRRVSDNIQAQIYLSVYGRSKAGLPLHLTATITSKNPQEIASEETLLKAAHQLKKDFHALYASPEAKGALAPCWLDAQASAELFLAFASKLEGERQRDPQEPQTFRAKIGQRVLPEFLTIRDDPTKEDFNNAPLLGHYNYDEEGVRSQDVLLVERGVLRNFLLSRRPVKGLPLASNGHGRAASNQAPHARAAILWVQSSVAADAKLIKARLIEEIKKRKLPFGVRVVGLEPIRQEERTGAHQTLRGIPRLLYYVYPDGKEELVHHGEIVGTPMKLMQSLLITGYDSQAFNFMRSGPGGELPLSVISPSVLVSEIEIQKGSNRPVRPPILKSPWEGKP